MKVNGRSFIVLLAALVVVSEPAHAELPAWWNEMVTPAPASGASAPKPGTSDVVVQPIRTPGNDGDGPVLEQYSITPAPVETLEERARSQVSTPSIAAQPPVPVPEVDERYGIQPGDLLAISVWREPELTREVRVSPDGRITYPLIGELHVDGATVEVLRSQLEAGLARYISAAVVDVSIKEVMGNRVYVLGKVNRPGMYPFTKSLDVVQALSLAGGTAKFAEIDEIKILRRVEGQQLAFEFHYSDVERGRDLEQNIVLKSGDVIVVP